MGVKNIIESINNDFDTIVELKGNNIKKRWEIHYRLLNSIRTLESQLLKSGHMDSYKQASIDEFREIALRIRPTNGLIHYG